MKNLQTNLDRARENNIGSETVSYAQCQNPRKAAIYPPEDEYDQPNAKNAETKNH
jgi:hypothetical protein